jgi:hypothetical protein
VTAGCSYTGAADKYVIKASCGIRNLAEKYVCVGNKTLVVSGMSRGEIPVRSGVDVNALPGGERGVQTLRAKLRILVLDTGCLEGVIGPKGCTKSVYVSHAIRTSELMTRQGKC